MSIDVCVYVLGCACVRVCIDGWIDGWMNGFVCACVSIDACVYMRAFVCVCVCVCECELV